MNMEEYIRALETYVASRKLNVEDGESTLFILTLGGGYTGTI